MEDVLEKSVTWVDVQRPPGYAAMTRLHFGRMTVPTLNDAGATCSCIPEEQLVLIVNHVRKMERENGMGKKDYNYPLQQLCQYRRGAKMQGAGSNGVMEVEFGALLRVEFIAEGNNRGITRP